MIGAAPAGGSGMLAVFCALDPQWHREFREWLRDDMMPARLRIGFPACASYDLLTGAACNAGAPEPFATVYETASIGALYDAPYQGLRANRDARDTAFHARFLRPSRFTLSWVGPELRAQAGTGTAGPGGLGPISVFDRFDLPAAHVQDFNAWYVTRYLPGLAGVPGLRRVRRYLAMEGEPRHLIVHELEDEGALSAPAWQGERDRLRAAMTPAGRVTSGAYVRVLGLTL